MKYVSPSVRETAFNCPHCGALAKQFWHVVQTKVPSKEDKPIVIPVDDDRDFSRIEDKEQRDRLLKWYEKMKKGLPFFDVTDSANYKVINICNVSVSRCYNCEDIAIWIYDRLVYPVRGEAPAANPDMPEDIRRDYDEASRILDLSPRGAAALVRLCIQKLCVHLGQPGKNINADIAALVKAGLDERIQKALDVVRVVGNNAVHPGNMDLRDDKATAESLFRLLNLVVEKTISEPKHVDEVYAMLPPGAHAAIQARDKE